MHLFAGAVLLASAVAGSGPAPFPIDPRPDLADVFKKAGVSGAIVVYDTGTGRGVASDPRRVDEPAIPASTFKIFNTMVALETGAIADEKTVLKWDGVERPIATWNKDMDMREAIRVSCVWFYQELARRAGPEKMQHWLDAVGYGNRNIGGGIDRFWLDGDLRITPREQIEFLRRLHDGKLPFSERSMRIVKEILPTEKTPGGAVVHGKTGWGARLKPQAGWYVGWVDLEGRTLYFATRVDILKDDDVKARIPATLEVLGRLEGGSAPGQR